MTTSAPSPLAWDRGRVGTVVALLGGTFLASLETTLLGTAMPRISAELHDVALYPWAFSIFLLASTAMLPTYGKLADILGRRRPYLAGLGLLILGSLLGGAARSMPLLIAARAVQGAGSGAIFLIAQIILGDLFSDTAQRSRMQSLFSAVWSISAVLGPVLGGLFVQYWSWRWAFYINVPLGLIIALVLAVSYQDQPVGVAKRFAIHLGVLLIAALAALYVGLGREGIRPGWLVLGLALGLVFAALNRRSAAPLLPPTLYRDPLLAMAYAAVAVNGAIQLAFISFVPLYLQGVLGLSPTRAGWMTSFPVTVAWTASSFFCGRLMVRRSREFVLRIGALGVLAATLNTAAALHYGAGMAGFVLFESGQFALGMGLGLVMTTLIITVQQRVSREQRGVATSGLHLHRQLGATLGVAALGMVFALRTVGQPASAELRLLPQVHGESAVAGATAAALAGALQSLAVLCVAAAIVAVAFCFLLRDRAPSPP